MQPNVFDLLFVITAVAFNLLIAALFVASKKMHLKAMRAFGIAGLIGIAFSVDRVAGYVVSISFWMLMGSLIYLYADWKKQAT